MMGTWYSPGKAAGAWHWPPTTPSSTEVKERTELYLYFPSVPSWQVTGWTELWGYCLCGAFMQFVWLIHAACKNWKVIFKEELLKFQDEFFFMGWERFSEGVCPTKKLKVGTMRLLYEMRVAALQGKNMLLNCQQMQT